MKKHYLVLFIFSFIIGYSYGQNYVLYGTTLNGGSSNEGVLFNYNITTGAQNGLFNFTGASNGSSPYGNVVPDSARGIFYGMTNSGGVNNEGAIYGYNNCSGESTLVSFKNNTLPSLPYGNLVYDTANGLFYGMTSAGGTSNLGAIFSLNPSTNSVSIVFSFNGTNGANPHGNLTLDPINGIYYGMTLNGGTGNSGVIFTFNPNTNLETVVLDLSITGYNANPYGSLTWDPHDSMLMGMTTISTGQGSCFTFNPLINRISIGTTFNCVWGDTPYGDLTYDPVNHYVFGMTSGAICGAGNIIEYIPNWTSRVLLNVAAKGTMPYGSLTWDPENGLFYSTTRLGGSKDSGVIFSYNPTTNLETVLMNFTKSSGTLPYGELMYDPVTKMLYGMTYAGGANNDGVIYKFNPNTNTETVLFNFNSADGANPWGDMAYYPGTGMLYGMTLNGGANNQGALFEFDTATNTETLIQNFGGYDSSEYQPYGNLVYDPSNSLYYGLTSKGGVNNNGTLFSYNPSTEKDISILHFNNTNYPMGSTPLASLVYDSSNTLLYGMAQTGGTSGEGVLFSFNPATGKDSTLVNFSGANGSNPQYNNLIHDPSNGLYYGMTEKGGANSDGIIFSLDPVSNTQTVLFNFNGANGQYPYGSLTYNPVNGLLYGMTYSGGSGGYGTLFNFNTSGNVENILVNFNGTGGANPEGSLLFDEYNGRLYGLTSKGGSNNDGIIFGFNPITNTDSILCNFNNTNGRYPIGDLCLINSSALRVSFSGKPSIICPLNSTTIDVSGGNNATYLWNNNATTSSITVSPTITTTYSVFVCDGIYSRDTSVTVTIYPLLSISQLQNVSCCGDSNGNATVAVDSGSAPFTYSWSTNPLQTNSQATGLKAGTYTVTVKDSNGCSATASITITQPPCLQDSLLASPSLGCNCHGTIEVFAYGGTKPYTYLWSNGRTNDTLHNLDSGWYRVRVCDANGCCITDSIHVPIGDPIHLYQTNVNCYGACDGSASVWTWGWNSYIWSPGGQTTDSINGLCAGTYTLTVTNLDTACSAQYVFTITQPPQLLVLATLISNVSCNGGHNGSASASASGGTPGYTYRWSDGESSSTATTLAAGTAVVTVTDANGCTATASIAITQPAVLSVIITNPSPPCNVTQTCYAAVSGGTSPYTFSWQYGSSTDFEIVNVQCPFGANIEDVHVTDSRGCIASNDIFLYSPVEWDYGTTQTNVSCHGGNNGSITMNVCGGSGLSTFTYHWNASSANAFPPSYTASNLSAGTYNVYVTDNNGCYTNTLTVTITQPAALIVTTTTTSAVCLTGGTATVSSITNGASPYTYSWSPSGGSNITATGLSAGTYTVHITDNNGCTGSATVSIAQTSNNLTVSINETSGVSCHGGSSGSISSNVSGGVSPYTYLWSPSGGTTDTAVGLSAGTYTLTVEDNDGCAGSASATITQPNSLNVSISVTSNVSCNGGTNGSASSLVSGGTPPYNYSWSPTGGTNANASGLSAGTYTLTVNDACGASAATVPITITQPVPISVSTSVINNISCNGGANGSASCTVGGGTKSYTYSWSPSGGSNAIATGLSAGTYTIAVHDSCGASAAASITITQPTISIFVNVTHNVNCYGGTNGNASSIVSGGASPYTYSWSNGKTTPNISSLSAGTYTLNVTDKNGCTSSGSIAITQPSSLSLSANTIANILCNGDKTGSASPIVSGGTPRYTYSWSGGGGTNTSASGLSAGTYTITVTDSCGASISASVNITQPAPINVTVYSIDDTGSNSGSAWVHITGGSEPYTYLWTPGGQTTDSITGLPGGRCTCTITDNNGCTTTTEVIVNNTTGVDNIINNTGQIKVYPNPNSGQFTIESLGANGRSFIEIYNVLGQRIYSTPLNFTKENNCEINISDKAAGVYFYRVLKEDGALVGSGKVVVQQ